jgi:hypothetical protein
VAILLGEARRARKTGSEAAGDADPRGFEVFEARAYEGVIRRESLVQRQSVAMRKSPEHGRELALSALECFLVLQPG